MCASCGCGCGGGGGGGGKGGGGTGTGTTKGGMGTTKGGMGTTKGGAGGGGTGTNGGAPVVGTWLLIRYDSADLGARPVPTGDVFWVSPDIWLTGGDVNGNPIGGEPATLFARVWNLGTLACAPVYVDFSFIAPSLGIPASAPKHIGRAWGSVPALDASVFECPVPWVSPLGASDIHSCLIVTCYAPLFPSEKPIAPGNPVADRHTGQHNFTIIEAGGGTELHFEVLLHNLGPLPAAVEVVGAAAWHRDGFGAGDFVLTPSLGAAVAAAANSSVPADNQLMARRAVVLEAHPTSGLHPLHPDAVAAAINVTRVVPGDVVDSNPFITPANRARPASSPFVALGPAHDLAPQQQATAQVTVAIPAEPTHPWFIAHLGQATGGALTGGYTIACRMAP